MASVFGYTIGNDVSERDMQKSDGQWTRAKGFDSFCPLGPWIETDLAGLGLDPADLEVTCTVDGEPRQQGRTSQLIFDVADADLLHLAGHDPAARRRRPHRHARPASARSRPGQRVECTIEGLGTLSNTVTAADAVSTAGGAR